MPIEPLSATDIRALGSSLVLNDARSVIKELVDNALDSQANTISIEISANTLDVIQVKDNGLGISGEDRQMLCKKGCTSKIRTIQDLGLLGGSSLGFRGEAMASVAALSNAVHITTRIDGEPAGSISKFGPNGQLLSSTTASHPVGTTIRVQDFLRIIPVRRQTAIKAASRTLTDIKKLVQCYAFARPTVRYSFKVLRAQNDKYKWTYGPGSGSVCLLNTTAKIMGQETAARCEARFWNSPEEHDPKRSYTIDAVVAKPDQEYKSIGLKGHFVSVDGRPVSATRGVFKDFVKLYQIYCKNSAPSATSTERSTDSFLCLHLKCPQGSYDVNIEPAKDEVLFTESRKISSLLEAFLISVYGNLSQPKSTGFQDRPSTFEKPSPASRNQHSDHASVGRDSHSPEPRRCFGRDSPVPDMQKGSYTAIEKQPLRENTTTAEMEDDVLDQDHTSTSSEKQSSTLSPKPCRNMYDYDEDEPIVPQRPSSGQILEDESVEIHQPSIANPWTIAKLNAPLSASKSVPREEVKHLERPASGQIPADLDFQTKRAFLSREHFSQRSDESEPAFSPPVYQNPGPPIRRRAPVDQREIELEDIEFTQESPNSSSHRLSNSSNLSKPPGLLMSPLHGSGLLAHGHFQSRRDTRDGKPELNPVEIQSTQLTDPAEEPDQQPRSPINVGEAFVPPFRTPERPLPLHPPLILTPATSPLSEPQPAGRQLRGGSPNPGDQARTMPLSQTHQHPLSSPPRLRPSPQSIFNVSRQTLPARAGDLEEIMDFEHRKKAVSAQRKKQMKLDHQRFNPGQLSQIQRDSSGFTPASNMVGSSASTFWKNTVPQINIADRPARPFGLESPESSHDSNHEPQSSTPRPNPHHNRYRAAKSALSRPNHQVLLSQSHLHSQNPFPQKDAVFDDAIPPLPDNDPRAHLFGHRKAHNSRTDFARPGPSRHSDLKAKRAKTSQLPFETVPPGSSLHDVAARPGSPFPSTTEDLEARMALVRKSDSYPDKGVNEFMRWDVVMDVDVERWKERMCRLIGERYVVRLSDGGESAAKAEDVRGRVNLADVLREHCERVCS